MPLEWTFRVRASMTATDRSIFARESILAITPLLAAGSSGTKASRLLRAKTGCSQGWILVMAMSPRRREWMLLMVWVAGSCCCGATGCAVGGRSVSIDSNSRIPFFGLELRERQRKSSGPPVRSIHSDHKTDVRIEPLSLPKGIGSRARLGEKRDRKPSPLAPVSVPRTDGNSPSLPAKGQAAAQIDFR